MWSVCNEAKCPTLPSSCSRRKSCKCLGGLRHGLCWPCKSVVTPDWPAYRLLRRGAEKWQEKGFMCSSWVKRILLNCGFDGKHSMRLVQIFPEVCQQPQKWSLIENSWEEVGAQLLSAFPCPRAVSLYGQSSGWGLCQGPGSLSWGLAGTLPSARLHLKGWNQLNLREYLSRAASRYFFWGLELTSDKYLQEELTNARFSAQGYRLPAGRVMMSSIVLWHPLSRPTGGHQ